MYSIIDEQEQSENHAKPLNQKVKLFTTFIKCDKGHKMSIQSKTSKYSCAKCKIRLDKDDLEQVFHSRLTEFIVSENEIEEYTKSTTSILTSKKYELTAMKKSLGDIGPN